MAKVIIIGSGGREGAFVNSLCQDRSITDIFCFPGSAGIRAIDPTRIQLFPDDSFGSLGAFIRVHRPDLTIVGPEKPLVKGIANLFEIAGLPIVGCSQQAAQLEGSKAFMKELLSTAGIPTAKYSIFTDPVDAQHYIEQQGAPIVVKADGLASGKGVIVAMTVAEALQAVQDIMVAKIFGDAGNQVVIEEYLEGPECSVIAFVDGDYILPLEAAQDYKRVGDGNTGLNTGGMGAYSPLPFYGPDLQETVLKEILYPTVRAMAKRGTPYRGILYAGLMLTNEGPKVLEFNIRFGDPEAQVILDRLLSPLFPLLLATATGNLSSLPLPIWLPEKTICLVLASEEYPKPLVKKQLILGIEKAQAEVCVLHSGTIRSDDGTQWLTHSGRVLSLVGPRDKVYKAAKYITFDGRPPKYRMDIG